LGTFLVRRHCDQIFTRRDPAIDRRRMADRELIGRDDVRVGLGIGHGQQLDLPLNRVAAPWPRLHRKSRRLGCREAIKIDLTRQGDAARHE
jgi:hypothetical protein